MLHRASPACTSAECLKTIGTPDVSIVRSVRCPLRYESPRSLQMQLVTFVFVSSPHALPITVKVSSSRRWNQIEEACCRGRSGCSALCMGEISQHLLHICMQHCTKSMKRVCWLCFMLYMLCCLCDKRRLSTYHANLPLTESPTARQHRGAPCCWQPTQRQAGGA